VPATGITLKSLAGDFRFALWFRQPLTRRTLGSSAPGPQCQNNENNRIELPCGIKGKEKFTISLENHKERFF
jgi:hypothetical protein